MQNIIKKIFKPRLKLMKGTRLTSFLFIGTSIVIAAGILFAANIYYNIDTGEVVVEHVERVTDVVKAIGGLVAGSDTLTAGYKLEVVGESRLATTTIHTGNVLRLYNPGNTAYVGFKATTTLSSVTYTWPGAPGGSGYVLTSDTSGNLSWTQAGTGGVGDVTAVGDCGSGDCFTGTQGTWLKFVSGSYTGTLNVGSLTASATYTLPAVSAGTYYFALTSGSLTANRLVYASGSYTLADNANFTVDATNRVLTIGSANNRGMLRVYSTNSNFLNFTPTSSLASSATYTWPTPPTGSSYVLSSNTSGDLFWVQAGTGGVGDVTAVGDCGSGDCFTGTQGTWLKFVSGSYTGTLNVGSLTASATYTLPAVSAGNYYFALTSGALGGGNRITFASGDYTLGSSANLTWDSGNNAVVVGASGVRGQLRLYSGSATNLLAFTPTTSLSASATYTWPGPPTTSGYILSSDTNGQLSWVAASAGDVTAVGDCGSGDCFTATSTSGQNLWFYTAGGARVKLTAASTAAERTITLPAADGTVALGTGSTNAVAYWTGTNTLGYEAQLATTRGGTGQNSSGWTGMVRVSGGTWSALTNSANYVAVWDSNGQFITGVATLDVSRGGTGRSSWTQWGVVYADSSTSLTNTGAGNTYQILTANTGAAPSWRNIDDLILATNGLTKSGTTQLTLKLGGTLTESTTITSTSTFDMIFNLAGTGDFKVQDNGTDILIVSDDGKIYFKSYPLAESGKQILREMVPIMGFELPVKTATTGEVQISRTIVTYPLNPCDAGTSRVHKLVIRYGSTATTTWKIATTTDFYTFSVPPSGGSTSTGSVYTVAVNIPTPAGGCASWNQGTDTSDWYVKVGPGGNEIMIYQIFLAGYDQIQ